MNELPHSATVGGPQGAPDGERLDFYASLRDKELARHDVAIVEGHTLVRRVLNSPYEVISILCDAGMVEEYEYLANGRCPVHTLEKSRLHELIGYKFHRGVLAAVRRLPLQTLPRHSQFQNPSDDGAGLPPGLYISCEHIQETSNLGAIIRSAAAFGAAGIILGPRSGDALSRKSVRASAGWVFSIPLFESPSPEQSIEVFRSGNARIFAAESRTNGAQPLNSLEIPAGISHGLLLLGHEFTGIGPELLKSVDDLLEIPMAPGIDSLNVAVAAGIFLYSICPRLPVNPAP